MIAPFGQVRPRGAAPRAPSYDPAAMAATATLTASLAASFAQTALANVAREYPNKPDHVQDGPDDVRTTRSLHPAFYGSFDWHSCVHMHWLLARVRRLFPGLPQRNAIDEIFDRHLTPANIERNARISNVPIHVPSSALTVGRGCSSWRMNCAARRMPAHSARLQLWRRLPMQSSAAIWRTCRCSGIRCGQDFMPTARSDCCSRSTMRVRRTNPRWRRRARMRRAAGLATTAMRPRRGNPRARISCRRR